MAYNQLNYLRKVKKVCDVFNEHYIDGITSQIGIYRKYIKPIFFISENTFRNYLSESEVNKRIKEIEDGIVTQKYKNKGYEPYHSNDPSQLTLF